MVGLVIISHSEKIATGTVEMARQMAESVPIKAAGGTYDGVLGTDASKISNAITNVYSEDGVIIIFDLGSAYMNAEMAIEFLDEDIYDKSKVKIAYCALVEGAITASVESIIGRSLDEILNSLESLKLNKAP